MPTHEMAPIPPPPAPPPAYTNMYGLAPMIGSVGASCLQRVDRTRGTERERSHDTDVDANIGLIPLFSRTENSLQ